MHTETPRSIETRAGRARTRVHRDGRTGRLVGARHGRGAGRVVGDGAQHPGAPRGRRVRAAAAHVGGTDSNRSRLSLLRGPAARCETAEPDGERRRSPAAARPFGPAARFAAAPGVARGGAGVGPHRLRPAAGAGRRRVRSRRVHSPQRVARARRHRRARRRRHSEGHRYQRAARRRRSQAGGQLLERRVLGPAAPSRPPSRARSHQRRAPAVRRAAGPRDAPGNLDVRRSARQPDHLRGRRRDAARKHARARARDPADAAPDDGRETAARPAAERVHRRSRIDGGHRRRTPRPEPQVVQSDRLNLRRRDGRRHGGRDWADAYALPRAIDVVEGAAQAVSRVLRDPN